MSTLLSPCLPCSLLQDHAIALMHMWQSYAESHARLRGDEGYIPEAVRFGSDKDDLPTLKALLEHHEICLPDKTMRVMLLKPRADVTVEASEDGYLSMINATKQYCKTGKFENLDYSILPCGRGGGTTTIMGTAVKYGQVWFMLLSYTLCIVRPCIPPLNTFLYAGQVVQLVEQRFSQLELQESLRISSNGPTSAHRLTRPLS